MTSLSEIKEETSVSQIPITGQMKQMPSQAPASIQNPNKLNYKLFWRLTRGVKDYSARIMRFAKACWINGELSLVRTTNLDTFSRRFSTGRKETSLNH